MARHCPLLGCTGVLQKEQIQALCVVGFQCCRRYCVRYCDCELRQMPPSVILWMMWSISRRGRSLFWCVHVKYIFYCLKKWILWAGTGLYGASEFIQLKWRSDALVGPRWKDLSSTPTQNCFPVSSFNMCFSELCYPQHKNQPVLPWFQCVCPAAAAKPERGFHCAQASSAGTKAPHIDTWTTSTESVCVLLWPFNLSLQT